MQISRKTFLQFHKVTLDHNSENKLDTINDDMATMILSFAPINLDYVQVCNRFIS